MAVALIILFCSSFSAEPHAGLPQNRAKATQSAVTGLVLLGKIVISLLLCFVPPLLGPDSTLLWPSLP